MDTWDEQKYEITSVVIEKGITSIGMWMFEECSNLNNITIPDSVTSIGASAFEGCTSLKDVNYAGSRNNLLIRKEGNEKLRNATWYCTNAEIYTEGNITYAVNEDKTSCAVIEVGEDLSGKIQIPEKVKETYSK